MSYPLSIALAGNPNAGKTTLFNALTGARQHVGNWPGKTVEKKTGALVHAGRRLDITDLPGAYSLSAYTLEEVVTRDFVLNEKPDVLVAVADASNLERNLYLVVQLLELERPAVVVLNMMDVAARQGTTFDIACLERELDTPIVTACARRDEGLAQVAAAAVNVYEGPRPPFLLDYGAAIEAEVARLQAALEATPALRDLYPTRWTAIKLLEGDAAISGKVAALAGTVVPAMAAKSRAALEALLGEEADTAIADRRYAWIHSLVGRARRGGLGEMVTLSDRIDQYATHPWLGIPLFLLAMWFVFKITTDLSAPWVDWFNGVLSGPVSGWAVALLGAAGLSISWQASLVVNGLLAGVGTVLAFIPVLLTLYVALAVLEDSGYMARGAFVMDRLMNRLGLQGRSFLPLMVGFGCSVPAIYATRTLATERDRILTGMLVPFMSCGARLPVYVLFAAVFFPGRASLIILTLYLLGIGVALVLGFALRRTLLPAEGASGLVMELPPYRMPSARSIRFQVWQRTRAFLQHAASLILATTLGIWLLTSIPVGAGSFAAVPLSQSAFGRVSALVAPAFRPLGFGSWQAGGALISGLVAKEVVVSTMTQTYGVQNAAHTTGLSLTAGLSEMATSFARAVVETLRAIPGLVGINLARDSSRAEEGLATALRNGFAASSGDHPSAAALSFMVFVLLYTPCMATLAAERHELGVRWAWFSVVGQLAIAWLAALAVYQFGRLF